MDRYDFIERIDKERRDMPFQHPLKGEVEDELVRVF